MSSYGDDKLWIDQGTSEIGECLHDLVSSIADNICDLSIDPILLGRHYVVSPGLKSQMMLRFQFQYGPRVWSKTGLFSHDRLPDYENKLTTAFKELDSSKWYELVEDLHDATIAHKHGSENRYFQSILAFQRDGVWLVGRDQSDDVYVTYKIGQNRLELLGRAKAPQLNRLSDVWRDPVRAPTDNRQYSPKPDPSHIQQELCWRFQNKIDMSLDDLMLEAIKKMKVFGSDIALVWSESRFNDCFNDKNWTGVRVDDYFWESGSYFMNNAQALSRAPEKFYLALGLLHQLITSRIGEIFTHSYGPSIQPMDVAGLFFQDGDFLFAYSSSYGDDGPVYRIHPETGNLELIGVATRIDWRLNPFDMPLVNGKRTRRRQRALHWFTLDEYFGGLSKEKQLMADVPALRGDIWESYF